MILLFTVLLAVFLVPSPWGAVLVLLGLLAEAGEIAWGLHLAKARPKTGAEAMVGMTAEVVSSCRPTGQVRVNGELWEAACEEGADPGATVRIEALEGLTLVVVPAAGR
jgi:membrane-bound serine protease (ClpP class)